MSWRDTLQRSATIVPEANHEYAALAQLLEDVVAPRENKRCWGAKGK